MGIFNRWTDGFSDEKGKECTADLFERVDVSYGEGEIDELNQIIPFNNINVRKFSDLIYLSASLHVKYGRKRKESPETERENASGRSDNLICVYKERERRKQK